MLGLFKKGDSLPKDQIPPQEFLDWAQNETKFTPDNWELEQSLYQLVFIHDDLKGGVRINNQLWEVGFKICEAVSQEGFCFFVQKYSENGSKMDVPVALTMKSAVKIVPWAETKGAPSAHVHGILYAVPSYLIKTLDTMKENGVQYVRRRVPLRFDYQDRLAFKERSQIENFARDFLGYTVTKAVITSPIIKSTTVEAWMYVGKNDYWEDQINNLNFVPVPLEKNKRTKHIYYKYDLQE
jgi:hypothetical protein